MSKKILKKEIQILLDMGYIIRPDKPHITDISYSLVHYHKSTSIFSRIPFDLIKYELIPYLSTAFNIYNNLSRFKIILEKKRVKWVIFFDVSKFSKYDIPITKIVSTNNKFVNLRSIKNRIKDKYYAIYIRWLDRFTLPFIMLQIRLVMNKWLIANNIR